MRSTATGTTEFDLGRMFKLFLNGPLGIFAIALLTDLLSNRRQRLASWTDSRDRRESKGLLGVRLVALLSLFTLFASTCLRLLITFDQITPITVLGTALFGSIIVFAIWFPIANAVLGISREKTRPDEIFAVIIAWLVFGLCIALLFAAIPCRDTRQLEAFQLKGYLVSGGPYVASGTLPTSTIDGQVAGKLKVRFLDSRSGAVLGEDQREFQEDPPGRHFISLEPVRLRLTGTLPKQVSEARTSVLAEISFEGTGKVFSDGRTSVSAFGPGGQSVAYRTTQLVLSGTLAKGGLDLLEQTRLCKATGIMWNMSWYGEVLVNLIGIAAVGWVLSTTLIKRL